MSSEVVSVHGEIIPVRADLLTAAPVADAVALQRAFLDLCTALLDPTDFQTIGGKEYKTKSAWRKLAAAFNVSDEILGRDYTYNPDTGRIVRAEYTVRATAPNGRQSVGVGICSIFEPRGFANSEHDIPATAHTRAKNRAFSDLFGLGEVSADEVTYQGNVSGGAGPGSGESQAKRTPSRKGSGPTPSEALGAIAGADAFMVRLNALPQAQLRAFNDWRKSAHLSVPPASLEVLATMLGELARLEQDAANEKDAYG
jgi:hypothetical protein